MTLRRLLAKLICPQVFKELSNEGYKSWYLVGQIDDLIRWMPLNGESNLTAQWLHQIYYSHFKEIGVPSYSKLPTHISDFRDFIKSRCGPRPYLIASDGVPPRKGEFEK